MKTPQQKAADTLRERYGADYFSKLGSHNNRPNRNNSEHMRKIGKIGLGIRWNHKQDNIPTDNINKEMKGE
jgi:hypothetical protein